MMMGSNRFGSSGRGSFGSTGFSSTGNLSSFESQASNSDDSMNTFQICFKAGHTVLNVGTYLKKITYLSHQDNFREKKVQSLLI